MKIVIDIHEEVYKSIQDNDYCGISNADMYNAIKKGTPLDMAIRALKNEQTDGDLISRQAVIDKIRSMDRNDHIDEYTENVIEYFEKLPSAEKTANKININEYVKVKLTDYGKEIFYHQYDNLNKTYGKEIIKPSYPTVDSDGYTSFQLWYFMNLYGRYIDMGVQNVIEPLEIVFESAEKTAEWEWVQYESLPDFGNYHCSECRHIEHEIDGYNYCPNCGAKMKGWKNE